MRTLASLAAALALAAPAAAQDLVVASKNFTENRLLGEIVTQWIEARTELEVRHTASLGGTMVCWEALRAGEIDLYVDYTGTGWSIILQEQGKVAEPLRAFLHVQEGYRERFDVEWLAPFGLNNTYALALRRDLAEELGATRISDLIGRGADVRAGFSIEFMNREDGWPGLREHYAGLDLAPRSMEHGLAYEALAGGSIDLVDAYSTDGKLGRFDVVVLADDLGLFPPYNAAPILRGDTLRAHPELREVLFELAFTIDDDRARELNRRVEVDGKGFEEVAHAFLVESGLLEGEVAAANTSAPRAERGLFSALWDDRGRLPELLGEHLVLVGIALALAALLAIPAGVWITHVHWLRRPVLGAASVLQTVPSLALLAFLIAVPWLGLGAVSAVVALVLYAVLPILRNTFTGLDSVDGELIDAARGLGLTPRQVLLRIQLPLAARTILAGLRTAAVISVGVATLAAFIGAGGLGQPIVEGLYLNDTALVLSGALPAALLAIAVDGLLGLVERAATPRGMRGS
ncbi:MAG TPA: glycine betaine ABC transporter substrate-binding protein [Planctomycetota bacterium]|nr:glycine betaine ABC transporter substrate-binding protein [Planctomycetota bacterium]